GSVRRAVRRSDFQARATGLAAPAHGHHGQGEDEENRAGREQARERGPHPARSLGQVPPSPSDHDPSEERAQDRDQQKASRTIVGLSGGLRPDELHAEPSRAESAAGPGGRREAALEARSSANRTSAASGPGIEPPVPGFNAFILLAAQRRGN